MSDDKSHGAIAITGDAGIQMCGKTHLDLVPVRMWHCNHCGQQMITPEDWVPTHEGDHP